MFKNLINTSILRAAAAIALLAVFVSVPAGAKDKTLSKSEVKTLIVNGKTKMDHERIAQFFDAEATRYETDAREHGDLAKLYQKDTLTPTSSADSPGGAPLPTYFQHCDSLSKSLNRAGDDARALAAKHREMAKEAK